jgi:hypothetical protein
MIATAVGRGAGVAGSVIRCPATAICPAAKYSSNDAREMPVARKRSSTVTPSSPLPSCSSAMTGVSLDAPTEPDCSSRLATVTADASRGPPGDAMRAQGRR